MARRRVPPFDRLMAKVEKVDSGCWMWRGGTGGTKSTYGYFRPTTNAKDSKALVHRWMYEYAIGPIPAGFEVDHTCRVALCVNPEHLEAVEPLENQKRHRWDVCLKGHDLTDPANCSWDSAGRRRGCILCQRSRALARYYQNRETV